MCVQMLPKMLDHVFRIYDNVRSQKGVVVGFRGGGYNFVPTSKVPDHKWEQDESVKIVIASVRGSLKSDRVAPLSDRNITADMISSIT